MAGENILREKIKEYKETHKESLKDFDFGMLRMILEVVNEESVVKIARNPLDENRNWISDTPVHNLGKISVDDQGRLTLSMRGDKTEVTAGNLYEQIGKMKKSIPNRSSSVMLRVNDAKTVKITDIYSHALVKDSWSGLPFDIVLAYYEEN